jgi:hypothetical protein
VSSRTAVLVVGVPRSGTSWVGRVLGSTPGATYVGEPDNHEHSPFALRAKLGLPGHYYPRLDVGAAAPLYERLWAESLGSFRRRDDTTATHARRAIALRLLGGVSEATMRASFERGRPATARAALATMLAVPERPSVDQGNLVVKSVSAQLALEWIVARFPVKVLVVLREPLNVVSSWKEIGWLHAASDVLGELEAAAAHALEEEFAIPPLAEHTPVESAAQLVGLLTSALLGSLARHPEWTAVSHEDLYRHPHERFAAAAAELGLSWGEDVDELLDSLNRPGTGYETTRIASELEDVWRRRLTPEEEAQARTVLEGFRVDRAIDSLTRR